MTAYREQSSCGVGFVASLRNERSHSTLLLGLKALINLEHRGGTAPDLLTGDGAGVMTEIPHRLLGVRDGDAVASLFLPADPTNRVRSLKIFEETFQSLGLNVVQYREVPTDPSVLSPLGRKRPNFLMAFIQRPEASTTRYAFEKRLYVAKQLTRSRLWEAGIRKQFFFTSLSAGTIVYKALTRSRELPLFFTDLQSPDYDTRFVLFHRRFSTNTATAWDTAQPFRLAAHNGEINTISGNRAWAYSRERALGLREDELLTHRGISDSGSVNEMMEALFFRSSIPHPEDILAILMPQADNPHSFYRFWGRAMEPWDGPALFTFSDGRSVGARLDRSGFRPCRWARTASHFFLSSEAGSFELPESEIEAKGILAGGASVSVVLNSGQIQFQDASRARENRHATFDPRIVPLPRIAPPSHYRSQLDRLPLFGYSDEDIHRLIAPLLNENKEGIGSMGDTARLAVLSSEPRSLFDFFYQRFAQVTNPALDYLREKVVTDMSVVLGRKPNIFEPKEMVPLKLGVELEGPVLSLGQLEFLKGLSQEPGFEGAWPASITLDATFPATEGVGGLRAQIKEICAEITLAIKRQASVFILTDRGATAERPPIPPVLLVRAITHELNRLGTRLRGSMVVDSGEVRETHHLAVITAFGAAAVCPYLLLEMARFGSPFLPDRETSSDADTRELRLIQALEAGLLKIMSKMGISVFRSYHTAELCTILGLSKEVHDEFFPNHPSPVGGLSLDAILERTIRNFQPRKELVQNYLYKEHPKGLHGEKHSMTLARAKAAHRLIAAEKPSKQTYREYANAAGPISFRDLIKPKKAEHLRPLDEVQPAEEILRSFGSGAMSFGAISAESQRDLILAMREIGGRSNSGEGGENPFFFTEGITAHTKQVASGRFGVTAGYLMSGQEIQIKIAQGAKPGEGGQLMAVKVSAEIARARHSEENIDLISPPPMHDIYSIEDLKQLIYEFRQLKPDCRVSVKLVSGDNLGAIAVGVAKAGADIIHVAGHDGGTGAAPLSSMKHAGLPWELGLWEVHRMLTEQNIRHCVTLRTDGGLFTARDVITAAILGAEEFDFGKLMLVAEGCIMARVCEKNTCPTGIATHDPKFQRLYRGNKDKVVRMLKAIADEIREKLAEMGKRSLFELIGQTDLLEADPAHAGLVAERGLRLDYFLAETCPLGEKQSNPFIEIVSDLNSRLLQHAELGAPEGDLHFPILPRDRAVMATVNGALAQEKVRPVNKTRFIFHGSAGQGFGVFLEPGVSIKLYGEANDCVGKSMSGGKIVVTPASQACFRAAENAIIGNCALYGATGGMLLVNGVAGHRFAVRNSGATAVVEGVGIHACEYMTRGIVVILGKTGTNIGAGMTGGTLYLTRENLSHLNRAYLKSVPSVGEDWKALKALLFTYREETKSPTADRYLEDWDHAREIFVKCVPVSTKPKRLLEGVPDPLHRASPIEVRIGPPSQA